MATLEIRDLHVTVETEDGPKEILKGVDLTIKGGETHAIMGPNGSGKSTLAYSIAGHPKYTVTGGSVTLDGDDVLAMTVDERARAGLFLAMQYPVEVPGVSVSNFLRTAKTAIDGEAPKLRTWVKDVNTAMGEMKMDPAFASASVNEGFSGGEKKRHEILQLELLNPQVAVLDETDSGLDIDALKIVSEGVNRYREQGDRGVLLITHYTRILRYITPDFVHVFVDGRIAEEGGPELAERLEAEGYDKYVQRQRLTPRPSRKGSAMTVDTATARAAGRSRPDPGRLPDPGAHAGRRAPAGLPRQREHLAEAAGRDRRDGRPPRAAQRQRGPRHAPARCGVDRRLRGRPGQGRGVHQRALARRGDLHQERLRGAQPGREHPGLGRGPLAIGPGDEVLITEMEHHSNIVPWQLLTERKGATLRWFGLTDDGRLDLSNIDELITERTKVVSLTWVSNMLGTINPVAEIARRAHEVGALVLVDAAQAVPQMPVDVQAAGADFVAFTGHKVIGPTGIGVLWGRSELLEQLPPFLGGGEMIETVTMERSTYAGIPHKFEAGTPPIVEAVGLGAAVDYLAAIGMDNDRAHEEAITGYALEGLATVRGLTMLGPADAPTCAGGRSPSRSTACTRTTSARCWTRGASRSGPATTAPSRPTSGSACRRSTRASSYLYTTPAEIDALVEGLEHTKKYFKVD